MVYEREKRYALPLQLSFVFSSVIHISEVNSFCFVNNNLKNISKLFIR